MQINQTKMLTPKQEQELREKIILAKFPNLCRGTTNTKLNAKMIDPTLSDVLMALDKKEPCEFAMFVDEIVRIIDHADGKEPRCYQIVKHICDWNLDENYEGQSDETKQAIYNILIPTKK